MSSKGAQSRDRAAALPPSPRRDAYQFYIHDLLADPVCVIGLPRALCSAPAIFVAPAGWFPPSRKLLTVMHFEIHDAAFFIHPSIFFLFLKKSKTFTRTQESSERLNLNLYSIHRGVHTRQ